MAEEATAATETETPAEPVEGATGEPANDTKAAANDNAQPKPPTEEEFAALVERFGPDKAIQIVAKKLNYTVDGATVSVAERAALREEKRQTKAALDRRQREIEEALSSKVKESESEIEFGRALKAAYQAGDFDQLARALGKKDWNDIQDEFIAKLADPNHKRLTELEQRIKDKEAAEDQQRQRYEAQQKEQQKAQAVYNYKVNTIVPNMKESKSSVLRELADNPDVVNMIYAIQNEHWDGGRPISVEDALEKPLPNGKIALKLILRGWADQLGRAFKPEEAPAPATNGTKAKGKTEPKPGVAPSSHKALDDTEWLQNGAAELAAAFKADEAREAEERRKGNSARET